MRTSVLTGTEGDAGKENKVLVSQSEDFSSSLTRDLTSVHY